MEGYLIYIKKIVRIFINLKNQRSTSMKNRDYLKKRLISHKKLAQERTILANERNTLAYIRTGFTSFALGIALIKLFEENIKYVYAGYSALGIGAILIIFGIIYYPLRKKNILSY
jgi:putative membrane protein